MNSGKCGQVGQNFDARQALWERSRPELWIAVTTMPSEGGEGNDCWKTDFFKLVQFDHLICCQSNEDVKWEVSGK